MKPGDGCILVTDSYLQTKYTALLDQWETDRAADAWAVQKRIVAGTDPDALRRQLLALCAKVTNLHVFFAGDDVPKLYRGFDPDGHGWRSHLADWWYITDDFSNVQGGGVGRVWFAAQPGADADSAGLYQRYFQKRHRAYASMAAVAPVVSFVDHLHYQNYAGMGDGARRGVPAALLEELYTGDPDPTLTDWNKNGRVIGGAFSGGYPGGLYYFGSSAEYRIADPRVPIFFAYGSMLTEYALPDNFLVAALTASHTLVALWNYCGTMGYQGLLAGKTVGECARGMAQSTGFLSSIMGDPTVALSQPVLTAQQILMAVQANPVKYPDYSADASKLLLTLPTTPPGPDPTQPPPATGGFNLPALGPNAKVQYWPGVFALAQPWQGSSDQCNWLQANSAAQNGPTPCLLLQRYNIATEPAAWVTLTGLTPGQSYSLRALVAYREGFAGGRLEVSLDADLVATLAVPSGISNWTPVSFAFTAKAASQVLRITAKGAGNISCYVANLAAA